MSIAHFKGTKPLLWKQIKSKGLFGEKKDKALGFELLGYGRLVVIWV